MHETHNLYAMSNSLNMVKGISIVFVDDRFMNDLKSMVNAVNKALKGDSSPSVYRRLRRLRRVGVLSKRRGHIELYTNPIVVASMEVEDCGIKIRQFAILIEINREVKCVGSACPNAPCSSCPLINECSHVVKAIKEKLNVNNIEGVTPIEASKSIIKTYLNTMRWGRLDAYCQVRARRVYVGKFIYVKPGYVRVKAS